MRKESRTDKLLKDGIPKYVRCYDNGGKTADRYTVVFTGNYAGRNGCDYIGMSTHPYSPQGVGMHGNSKNIIDVSKHGFAPAIGRKNHLGVRIEFNALPEDCKKLVLSDYKEIWGL